MKKVDFLSSRDTMLFLCAPVLAILALLFLRSSFYNYMAESAQHEDNYMTESVQDEEQTITKSITFAQIGDIYVCNLCLMVSIVNAVAKAFGRFEELQERIPTECAIAKMRHFNESIVQDMLELNWLIPHKDTQVDQSKHLKEALVTSLTGLDLPIPNFVISVIDETDELGADYWKDKTWITISETSSVFVKFVLLHKPGHFDLIGEPILE